MAKYWFPELKNHIKQEGLTQVEFRRRAREISPTPKERTWSNSMNPKYGVSETTAYGIVKILNGLDIFKEICVFKEIVN